MVSTTRDGRWRISCFGLVLGMPDFFLFFFMFFFLGLLGFSRLFFSSLNREKRGLAVVAGWSFRDGLD